ncbi:hypothetical protein D3C76_1324210 [compost metagenome]
MTDEEFPMDDRSHATGEQAMAQTQAVQAVETLEAGLTFDHLDGVGARLEGFGHGHLACVKRLCSAHPTPW